MINLDDIDETTFTDGQTHIAQEIESQRQLYDVIARIRTPNELFKLMMLGEILARKKSVMRLHIKYLMGARMDAAIDDSQPFTLKVVCDMINTLPIYSVDIFAPHSNVPSLLLNDYNDTVETENNFYRKVIKNTLKEHKSFSLVLPDAGAGKRWYLKFAKNFADIFTANNIDVVECSKKRDQQTQQLKEFVVPSEVQKHCLILDDLCDGGRTFMGLGEKLKEKGALNVDLGVCHGIFSYGYDLDHISDIWTTKSFRPHDESPDHVHIYNI